MSWKIMHTVASLEAASKGRITLLWLLDQEAVFKSHVLSARLSLHFCGWILIPVNDDVTPWVCRAALYYSWGRALTALLLRFVGASVHCYCALSRAPFEARPLLLFSRLLQTSVHYTHWSKTHYCHYYLKAFLHTFFWNNWHQKYFWALVFPKDPVCHCWILARPGCITAAFEVFPSSNGQLLVY